MGSFFSKKKEPVKEVDNLRTAPLRFLGYASEIGECGCSFMCCDSRFLRATYFLTGGYILGDIIHKGYKASNLDNKENAAKNISLAVMDAGIWQLFASVIFPSYAINRIDHYSGRLIRGMGLQLNHARNVPVLFGLVAIPLIYKPIDNFADFILDNTFRKWTTTKKPLKN